MDPASIVVFHGFGHEITFLEYLFRVVLYLVAFGGIAVVVHWGVGAVNTAHSEVVEKRDGRERDP